MNRNLIILTLVSLFWFPIYSQSNETFKSTLERSPVSIKSLESMIILNQGRQKPLHTFAKVKLLEFSSKSMIYVDGKKINALEWLVRVLFTPDEASNDPSFRITNPEVLQSIDLDSLPLQRNYSFNQLKRGLEALANLSSQISQIEPKERTLVEAQIFRLFRSITDYINLSAAFQFALPNSVFVIHDTSNARILGVPVGRANSYFDLFIKGNSLNQEFNKIPIDQKIKWSDANTEIFRISRQLFRWSNFYKGVPFKVIPIKEAEKLSWISPWSILETKNIEFFSLISKINNISKAFFDGDQISFDENVKSFNEWVILNSPFVIKSPKLEIFYNKMDFFYRAEILYGLVFLLLLFWLIRPSVWLYRVSLLLFLLGFLLHTCGILSRMIILSRAPVSNLFDTFVFVGWICVLLGLLVELFQRKKIGWLLASLSGLILLLISGKYAAEGDTLQVLVAVLDSNFWLATHVVTITMGYGGVCFAGVTGHFYVLLVIFKRSKQKQKEVFKMMYGMAAFGLVLSFVGTILGGIWADQSWGRFWGWDPKENGALLIVLWGAIMFHARLTGWIKDFGFAIFTILGISVVVFAWFGVNLLGVGLHSYGFTSGVFNRMILFYILDLLFVIFSLAFYFCLKNKP